MSVGSLALADSTVIALAGKRMNRVDHEITLSQLGEGLVGRMVAAVSTSLATRLMNRMANRFADDAIWFKGAAEDVWGDNIDVRSTSHLIYPRLEKSMREQRSLRQMLLELQKQRGTHPQLKRAVENLLSQLTELFDAMEALRWTLLELEANHSKIATGYSATSPEEFDQLFARLEREA